MQILSHECVSLAMFAWHTVLSLKLGYLCVRDQGHISIGEASGPYMWAAFDPTVQDRLSQRVDNQDSAVQ